MFKKLLEKAEAAGFKTAVAKGKLACPSCRAKPATMPSRPDDAITCASCGTIASASEWSSSSESGQLVGNPDRPPANTRITRASDHTGSMVWNIPASGKSGGLFFFAIFWCSITAIVSASLLFSDDMDRPRSMPDLLAFPFFGLFWAVGLGMFYFACRNKYAKHRISANRSKVTLRRELFGRSSEKSLPGDSITSVQQVEFYQKNYQPVLGIEIRGKHGKLRFGSILTDEEKAWLVADLRRVILGVHGPQENQARPANARQSHFSFPLPKSSSHLWALAIMLLLMGLGFICVGIFFIDPDTGKETKSAPFFIKQFVSLFNTMSGAFRLLWTLMSGVMAAGGLSLLVWLFKTRDQQTHIEGTDSQIAIRTTRHGLVLKERVFPRPSVAAIRASVSGSSNGKPMKRVELIVDDKAEIIARWLDGEKADALVAEVRRVLF